jgi:hypothetical protein
MPICMSKENALVASDEIGYIYWIVCDWQFKQAPTKKCKVALNSSNTSETPVLTIARPTGKVVGQIETLNL